MKICFVKYPGKATPVELQIVAVDQKKEEEYDDDDDDDNDNDNNNNNNNNNNNDYYDDDMNSYEASWQECRLKWCLRSRSKDRGGHNGWTEDDDDDEDGSGRRTVGRRNPSEKRQACSSDSTGSSQEEQDATAAVAAAAAAASSRRPKAKPLSRVQSVRHDTAAHRYRTRQRVAAEMLDEQRAEASAAAARDLCRSSAAKIKKSLSFRNPVAKKVATGGDRLQLYREPVSDEDRHNNNNNDDHHHHHQNHDQPQHHRDHDAQQYLQRQQQLAAAIAPSAAAPSVATIATAPAGTAAAVQQDAVAQDNFAIPRPKLIVPVHTYGLRKRRTGNTISSNRTASDSNAKSASACTVASSSSCSAGGSSSSADSKKHHNSCPGISVIWRKCRDDVRSVRLGGMTGSLRLSALLLLLLSRWAYADLEKGEDEYVRSWVIIEEQLVPPSRDEVLAAGSDIAGGGSAGGVGRRITPKSVFVAPSFNKCSEGYRPDSMGRCVKVVKLNQAAQWDFLIKQLNSMYGAGAAVGGGGFPMPAASAFQPPPMTTTTAEPSLQKTDSPGPFQLNIPLAGGIDFSNQMTDSVDEQFTTSTSAGAGTTITDDDGAVSTNPVSTIITTNPDDDDVDVYTNDHTTVASITTNAVSSSTTKPRPYRNRYQTQTEDNANTVTPTYDLQTYSTNIATDMKTKYVDSIRASTVGMDDSLQTTSSTITAIPSSSSTPNVVTTTAVGVMDIEGQMTTTTVSTPTTTEIKEEDVMTVLAVAAAADVSDDIGPSFTTRLPSTTTRISFTTSSGGRTQHLATDTVTPEYYNDQSEDPTSVSKLDCSAPNAYLYYPACASLRQQQQLQQQQLQQLQQKQVLLQQHQQQQQIYQQQQQFYQQQQLQQHNHVTTALMKRPIPSGGVQVRFPEEEDHTSSVVAEDANLIRFPGLTPYRTTNKMYESSRHPTWWPTGWPEQQQQSGDTVNRQHQQYRIQHHIPQQQQDARLWEFGSRLPKSTTTTTAVPPSPPPTQWFHRFF